MAVANEQAARVSRRFPAVSVVLLNWNGWRDTLECLASLEHLNYPNYNIIVVDNASTDASTVKIHAAYPKITILQSSANLGFAGGNNVGIRHAIEREADYVWLLNNDTAADPHALTELVAVAEECPSAGAVGSIIYDYAAPTQVQIWGGGYVNFVFGLTAPLLSSTQKAKLHYISGASILVRSLAFRNVGLLDDNYFMYWEDADFSFLLREYGWQLAVSENAWVYHKGSSTAGKNSALYDKLFNHSAALFFKRHAYLPVLPVTLGGLGRTVKRIASGNLRRTGATVQGILGGIRAARAERLGAGVGAESAPSSPRHVVFLRSYPINPEPRVEKEARALHEKGWKVTVLGWDRESRLTTAFQKREYADIQLYKGKGKFGVGTRNLLGLIKWNLYLLRWLAKNRRAYTHIHACDFDTVLPAIVMRQLFGKKVIYDIFDFYSDMARSAPEWLRRAVRIIDSWVISRADGIIIVDENRRQHLTKAKPKRVEIIYNSPEQTFMSIVPTSLDPDRDGQLHIAYAGMLHLERGLLEMLDVVARNPYMVLHLAGSGSDEAAIIARASSIPNVCFFGRVDYERAMQINAHADLLFATYDPAIPINRTSSANKLFEAMMLGKPIIVAEGTSMDRVVSTYDLGKVVRYGDRTALERALTEIHAMTPDDKDALRARAWNCFQASFAWEVMRQRLIQLYDAI